MASLSEMLGRPGVPGEALVAADPLFAQKWPNLWLLLSAAKDDAGKPRRAPTVSFLVEDGLWKMGVNERNFQMSLWKAARTFGEVLTALEDCLANGTAEWRKTDWKASGKR